MARKGLFKAARLINEDAIARVRERTGEPVRVAHTALLPHVDLEGTRLTELARRMGVTKQAVGQLVDELEQMGQRVGSAFSTPTWPEAFASRPRRRGGRRAEPPVARGSGRAK